MYLQERQKNHQNLVFHFAMAAQVDEKNVTEPAHICPHRLSV